MENNNKQLLIKRILEQKLQGVTSVERSSGLGGSTSSSSESETGLSECIDTVCTGGHCATAPNATLAVCTSHCIPEEPQCRQIPV
jgi:hypothetical protein